MAFQNQGGDAIASIFSAIGNDQAPDIRHKALSPQGDTAYSNLFSDYSKLLGNQTAGLQDFTSQYKALTPQLAGLDQLHASTLGDLVNRAINFNPTKYLQDTGNFYFGNLDKYLNRGLQAGTAALNQARAAAGYGDRAPDGSFALQNANRITSNLLPAFNNIVDQSRLAGSQQNQDYLQNLAQIPTLQQLQTNALQATPFRALVPSQIQQQQLQGNLGTVNDLTKAQLANWYFYNQPNWMQMVGDVGAGINAGVNNSLDTINHAASTYANVMGAGGGGGGIGSMFGGGGGGGGGGQPNLSGGSSLNTGQFQGEWVPPVNSAANQWPVGLGGYSQYQLPPPTYQPPVYYGGYGSQNPYSQYGGFFS